MPIDETAIAIKKVAEQYELYKDIVKIGLGAIIGSIGTIIGILINNKHEIKKIDKTLISEKEKNKTETNIRLLENATYEIEQYTTKIKFIIKIWYMCFVNNNNMTYKEIEETDIYKTAIINYQESVKNIEKAKAILILINAIDIKNIIMTHHDIIIMQHNQLKLNSTTIKIKDIYKPIEEKIHLEEKKLEEAIIKFYQKI